MPVAMPTLFCQPQDVFEKFGVEALQLRLDDQNQASGQSIQASATAAVGATTITVPATQYAMLRGTLLVFSDAAMEAPVEVTLNAAAAAGATSLTVVALATEVPSGAIAIDNGVNVWLGGMLLKACRIATNKCQDYLLTRYDMTSLTNSWTVMDWATSIAAHWLATRLFRAAPQQIQSAYELAIEELKEVRSGQMNLANTGPRTSEWPSLSNVTVDPTYTVRKVRVEASISEPTPTQYPQAVDWNSYLLFEW